MLHINNLRDNLVPVFQSTTDDSPIRSIRIHTRVIPRNGSSWNRPRWLSPLPDSHVDAVTIHPGVSNNCGAVALHQLTLALSERRSIYREARDSRQELTM